MQSNVPLMQIAERREIITSINNTTIDSEIEELSSEEDGSFLESDSNLRDNPSTSSDDPPEYRLPANFFVSSSKNNYGDASKSDINMPSKSNLDGDIQKTIQETSLDRATRNELPPFVSGISTTYKMSVDTHESMLRHITNVADVSRGEDVKSAPLAGPNVMNIILVAAECAPWSKTGNKTLNFV